MLYIKDIMALLNCDIEKANKVFDNMVLDFSQASTMQFNNEVLKFEELLFYFFKMHNPTTINQQGNDKGTQYRSAIFYINDDQRKTAEYVIDIVNQSNVWEAKVVTIIEKFQAFYPAEESHQKYLIKTARIR